jgi:uncharacterized protein (TIGR02001 family)
MKITKKPVLLAGLLVSSLGLMSVAHAADEVSSAASKAAEVASAWAVTTNVGYVSDYYARGISQSWHSPAIQGGIDIAHSSGFYAGGFGSSISSNTFSGGSTEFDLYGGYNGLIPAVEGLGYTVGAIGFFYPGASWKKYNLGGLAGTPETPNGGKFDTYEANAGLSYKWLSAKASVTLGNYFGAEKATGWDGDTKGTTYLELNAAYPLPVWDLTLIGHVGRLNVNGNLDLSKSSSVSPNRNTSPDYSDYKVGLSKVFKIAQSEGWNAGIYYVGATNGGAGGYWGKAGFGGSSFTGSPETRNLADGRAVVTLGRLF